MASKASKANGEPTYLLVTEERSPGFGYEKGYFHLYARVVRDRWEDGQRYPYGLDDSYGDGLLYTGIRASCQGDSNSQQHEHISDAVYGIGVEYHDAIGGSSVGLRQLRRMTKTLEHVSRKLAKLEETRGYPRTFGEYLGRLAEVTGCTGFAFQNTPRTVDVTGIQYAWKSLGEGVNDTNNRIWAWQRELKDRDREQAPAAAESEARS